MSIVLFLHSLLRWVVLVSLLLSIYQLITKKEALKTSKILLMSGHTTLLIGIIQFFTSPLGISLVNTWGMANVMHDRVGRFWVVEHTSGMLIALVFITIGHIKLKKQGGNSLTLVFYILALLIILASIPWPFRDLIGRPWLTLF